MSGSADTVFSAAQYDAAYPPGIERHWWMLARTWIVDRLLRSSPVPGGEVLEVGCGTGVVVAALRAAGHDCRGVELAPVRSVPAAAAHVRSACDAAVLPEDERARVRTILLLDVLEHLYDPASFLAGLQAAFPRLKCVIVSVPARPELWSNYDEHYGHHRRYEIDSLRALGAALGWRTNCIGHAFRLSYPPAWLLARLGVARAVHIRAPTRTVAIAVHRLLGGLSLLEWRLLPGAVPGSSIVARFELA